MRLLNLPGQVRFSRSAATASNIRGLCIASCVVVLAASAAARVRADVLYASTESLGHNVDRISAAGGVGVFASLPAGSFFPEGLVFDSANNLYTANDNTNDISRITPLGVVSQFKSLGAGTAPDGIAIDAANNLFVANHGARQILRITPSGIVTQYATLPAAATNTSGLAFDRAGLLYVADSDNGLIYRITSGGIVSNFTTLPKGSVPVGLAFDGSNNLYVADLLNDVIDRVTPLGTAEVFATLPGGAQPVGLAFDSAGTLYEGGVDHQIRKISATGVVSPFATGSDTFTYLAFTDDAGNRLSLPVPEPASAAILALSVLWAAGVRRRRSVEEKRL